MFERSQAIGVASLPTALGDAQPDLVRVLGPVGELSRIWRILAHPSARHRPAVAAFFDFVVGECQTLQALLAGWARCRAKPG